jgi:hypothetical protein
MRNKLLNFIGFTAYSLIAINAIGQAPNLGTTANFVLFSTDGAVVNTGISQLTGHVGTNNGSSTGFGNVNGVMHDNDAVSALAAVDLLIAYNELNSATPNFFPSPSLGNGTTLTAGVYALAGASTLNLDLTLDAENNSDAVFIFQIAGPLSTNADSKVKLINGAQACNVFWKVEGLVDMASGTTMRGTVIANNAGIQMNAGDTLEGRLLTTTGAISIDGIRAYTPIGCGSPSLTGPVIPELGEVGCYGIYTSDGSIANAGITTVTGDVGSNIGTTIGFDPLLVTGNIHPIPDGSTQQAAADLVVTYNYINNLIHDIELLYPAQFGANLVLTPHCYLLDAATNLTNTLYLNAQGNPDAVFVLKINGALTTSTFANIVLTNGAQAENVFWLVNGAVDINENSVFNGTLITQGAVSLFTGVTMNGRILTGVGEIETNAINGAANISPDCETIVGGEIVSIDEINIDQDRVNAYPNPFTNSVTVHIPENAKGIQTKLIVYDLLGTEILQVELNNSFTTIDTANLPAGMYFFAVLGSDNTMQTVRMIAQGQN